MAWLGARTKLAVAGVGGGVFRATTKWMKVVWHVHPGPSVFGNSVIRAFFSIIPDEPPFPRLHPELQAL